MGILDGKAIVITGSGAGIGAEYAKGCARQGASVVVNDIYAEDAEPSARRSAPRAAAWWSVRRTWPTGRRRGG
jgi:NAD(P)-dependent dehydrogenase (short-subunit alcohol dehydrogenase family)